MGCARSSPAGYAAGGQARASHRLAAADEHDVLHGPEVLEDREALRARDEDLHVAVVLMNEFNVAPEDVEQFLEVWADDAAFMKQQPGFISTQLHRGTAGSSTFVNVAVWESSRALGEAFGSPEFQERAARYPESAVAAPHVFERVAVPGICVA